MPGQFASVPQGNWGGGIFRGRLAPADSVYDAVNALVSDERELFKRGGTSYLTTSNVPASVIGLTDANTVAGQRTLAWTASQLYLVQSGTPVSMTLPAAFYTFTAFRRVATIGPEHVFLVREAASGQDALIYYAGSSRPYNFADATSATVTKGSRAVTGSATSWLTTLDAGTYLQGSGGTGIVESVQSNTALTLRDPWQGSSAVGAAMSAYSVRLEALVSRMDPTVSTPLENIFGSSSVGSTAQRVFIGNGNRVIFSRPYAPGYTLAYGFHSPTGLTTPPFSLDGGAHELPEGAIVSGLQAIGGAEIVFTTSGVWSLLNTDLDPIDDAGNVQHQVVALSRDVLLWNEGGIVPWAGGLLVPAVDDVFLMGQDGAVSPISASIRPLYRGYVKAGYSLGMAEVHRGHYLLPIVDGSNVVQDVLVCRLDLAGGHAWTRWAGHAAGGGYAQRVGASTRQPRLFGINGQRVTEISDCFSLPGAATDADASTPTFTVDTQDYAVGDGMRDAYVDRVRVEYEAAGVSPAVTVSWSAGTEGAAFTALTVARGGAASDGSDYSAWPVRKSRDRIRFRISSVSAVTKLILRRLEVLIRQSGRQ